MYARTRDVNEAVGINKAISQRLDFISIYLKATGFSGLFCIFMLLCNRKSVINDDKNYLFIVPDVIDISNDVHLY